MATNLDFPFSCILQHWHFCFSGNHVILVNPGLGDKLIVTKTDELLAESSLPEQEKGNSVLLQYKLLLL